MKSRPGILKIALIALVVFIILFILFFIINNVFLSWK